MNSRRNPADNLRIKALKLRISSKTATAQDCILFNILRGWPAWFGFRPYTNPKALHHGRDPYEGFMRASSAHGYEGLHPELAKELTPAQVTALLELRSQLAVQAYQKALDAGVTGSVLLGFLNRAMKATPQGKISVWRHCVETRIKADLLTKVCNGYLPRTAAPAWVPDWLFTTPRLALSREDRATLWRYLEHHDCGKPFVVVSDTNHQLHYPEHAQKSAEIWRQLGRPEKEASLMQRDMELHLMSAEDVPAFAQDPLAPLLLIAAIGALWANADAFGGESSTNFKMKLKQIDRRGRAICKLWASIPTSSMNPAA